MVSISDLTEAEIEAAASIDLVSFASSELGVTHENPRLLRERSLREELARPWARIRAARDTRCEVVGYYLYWHVVDEIQLLNVAVTPSLRRHGIGRALILDLLSLARNAGGARVLLEVRESNAAALALYESLGFRRFNVRNSYYADGESAIEMDLAL